MGLSSRPLVGEEVVEAYEAARQEVAEAQKKVDDVVDEQNEILRRPRRQALASYLLAVEEVDWVPEDEEAALRLVRVAEHWDLQTAILEAWAETFLEFRNGPPVEGDGANPRLVFVIWDAFARRPKEDYPQITEELRAAIESEKLLVAPLTKSLLRGRAPVDLEEVARRYEVLFAAIEVAWEQHLGRLGLKDESELELSDFSLPREQEELRRLIYGRRSPFSQKQEEEEKLYQESVLAELEQLRALVEELEEASPPEPPYAMAVREAEPVDLPVHIRGNHLNLAE